MGLQMRSQSIFVFKVFITNMTFLIPYLTVCLYVRFQTSFWCKSFTALFTFEYFVQFMDPANMFRISNIIFTYFRAIGALKFASMKFRIKIFKLFFLYKNLCSLINTTWSNDFFLLFNKWLPIIIMFYPLRDHRL